MQKLNPAHIEAELSPAQKQLLKSIAYFDTLASTNCYLLETAELQHGGVEICLAEQQSAGQAQHGRSWVSPYACNMYLSVLWPFQRSAAQLSGLSLTIGVAIVRALIAYGVDAGVLQLKWPNDIYANGKKLCGILCQTAKLHQDTLPCVIGIGLNIMMPTDIHIDQPFTDVQTLLNATPDRNKLIGICIREVLMACEQYAQQGLNGFLNEFQQHDYLRDKPLHLVLGKQTLAGIGRGIDNEGYLLVQTADGQIQRFTSGEASIKKA